METNTTVLSTRLRLAVRIEVFPERDGNSLRPDDPNSAQRDVRIEVFPERDGNHSKAETIAYQIAHVRIEVFPERDGN